MICPNCNTQNENGARFCCNCGAPLNNATQNVNRTEQSSYQQQPPYQQQNFQQQNFQQPPYQQVNNQGYFGRKAPIERREIALAIILSIVTCGIYGIYWFINLVNDLNVASDSPDDTSGIVVFLLSLVTCGIYSIYWYYQAGKKVAYITGKYGANSSENSILYVILAIFGLAIVNDALIQNELNKVAAN